MEKRYLRYYSLSQKRVNDPDWVDHEEYLYSKKTRFTSNGYIPKKNGMKYFVVDTLKLSEEHLAPEDINEIQDLILNEKLGSFLSKLN